MDDVALEFTEAALRHVAKTAISDKTGARGLRSVIEKALVQVQFDLPDLRDAGLNQSNHHSRCTNLVLP
jgi:ATP-dependent Clp protease ATP-binding subunit ClpX